MTPDPVTLTALGTEPIWPGFPADLLDLGDPVQAALEVERPASPGPSGGAAEREVATLRRIQAAVSAGRSPAEAVRAALAETMAATAATVGSLWLFRGDGDIVRAACCGLSREYLDEFAAIQGWSGVQRELGRIADVAIHDVGGAPWQTDAHLRLTPLLGASHFAVVPLRTRGLRVGAFLLGHTQPGWFRAHSLAFLRALGEVVALALDNTRLLAEVESVAASGRTRGPAIPVDRVLAALDAAMGLLSEDGETLLDHNGAFARLVAADLAHGPHPRALATLLPPDGARAIANAARSAAREVRRVTVPDLELRWEGREPGYWHVTVAPILSESGTGPRTLVMAVTDDTERRTLEERYRNAQKLEAVGTLAGGIAHEFNNLLTAVLGQVSLALLDLPADSPLAAGLRDCEQAALRAADLTQQLLGFGRRSPVQLRPTDLREVVHDSLPLFRYAIDPRIRIETRAADDLWPVHADAAQLGQALMNLCVNARDAMPEGGRLELRLRNESVLDATAPRRGDFVVLEVTDDGTGMPPDVRARVFEPFFTTKGSDRGTGLGLSVVHGIVEQHGGWIEVDSQVAAGTTFRLFLPRLAPAAGSPPSAPGQGETILVADDEPALRNLSRAILERLGYRVLLAADGQEAVELFRAHRADIALVLLDRTMPRRSGEETLALLHAEAPEVPVVLTSGYREREGRPAGAGDGAVGFLAKPYSPDQVAAVVRAALDSRR